jgi:hypothetical protein
MVTCESTFGYFTSLLINVTAQYEDCSQDTVGTVPIVLVAIWTTLALADM